MLHEKINELFTYEKEHFKSKILDIDYNKYKKGIEHCIPVDLYCKYKNGQKKRFVFKIMLMLPSGVYLTQDDFDNWVNSLQIEYNPDLIMDNHYVPVPTIHESNLVTKLDFPLWDESRFLAYSPMEKIIRVFSESVYTTHLRDI